MLSKISGNKPKFLPMSTPLNHTNISHPCNSLFEPSSANCSYNHRSHHHHHPYPAYLPSPTYHKNTHSHYEYTNQVNPFFWHATADNNYPTSNIYVPHLHVSTLKIRFEPTLPFTAYTSLDSHKPHAYS